MDLYKLDQAIDNYIVDKYPYEKHIKDGIFEAYVDYDEEISDTTVDKILRSKHPIEKLADVLDEWSNNYNDYSYEELKDLAQEVLKNLNQDLLNAAEKEDFDLNEYVKDYVLENYRYEYDPQDLNRDVCVNIIVDTGDGNYDFTLNSEREIHEETEDETIYYLPKKAALTWLLKQQGVMDESGTISDKSESNLIKSALEEIENCTYEMGQLTFLVNMPLIECCELIEQINQESVLTPKYEPYLSAGTGALTLGKNCECGLFNPWNGAGSCLELQLEKDVVIPFKYIHEIRLDSVETSRSGKYSIHDAYGVDDSIWKDCLKEVQPMAEQEIEAKLQEKSFAEEDLFQRNKEALKDKYKPLIFDMIASGSFEQPFHPEKFYSAKVGETINHSSSLNWLDTLCYGPTGAKQQNIEAFIDFCLEKGKKPSQVAQIVTEVLGEQSEFATKKVEKLLKADKTLKKESSVVGK